jgi:hypothetical protein
MPPSIALRQRWWLVPGEQILRRTTVENLRVTATLSWCKEDEWGVDLVVGVGGKDEETTWRALWVLEASELVIPTKGDEAKPPEAVVRPVKDALRASG